MSDNQEDGPASEQPPPVLARVMQDNQLREDMAVGDGFTGPKSVLADYRFHQQQERIRQQLAHQQHQNKLSQGGMATGWLQRQIEQEELERFGTQDQTNPSATSNILDISSAFAHTAAAVHETQQDMDELFRELEEELELDVHGDSAASTQAVGHALVQAFSAANAPPMRAMPKRFGTMRHIPATEFVAQVEKEPSSVTVIIHVFRPSNQDSRELDRLLSHIAKARPSIKFLKVDASDIPASFDPCVYPVLLVYHQSGVLKDTLLRIHDDIRNWSTNGTCEPEDLLDLLVKKQVIPDI